MSGITSLQFFRGVIVAGMLAEGKTLDDIETRISKIESLARLLNNPAGKTSAKKTGPHDGVEGFS